MTWQIFSLVVLIALTSCKTEESAVETQQEESIRQRYNLDVQFASLEDVKRVPLRLNKLKMELINELSSGQNIYRVSVECKPHALNGVLEKLNADEGIVGAQLHE